MAQVTLKTVVEMMKRRESLEDARFEFIKEQLATFAKKSDLANFPTKSELKAELKAELSKFATKDEMKAEFALVRRDLKVIRDQTAHITERVATIEHRLSTS